MSEIYKGNKDNKEFDLFIADLNGNLRGKRIPASGLESVMTQGVKLPQSVIGFDNWGDDVLGNGLVFETGDTDGVCLPVYDEPTSVPWAESPRGQILAMMYNMDGSPFYPDPRQLLVRIVERYKALGLTPVVATELEFYLLDGESEFKRRPEEPIISDGNGRRLSEIDCYSIDEMDCLEGFFTEVRQACEAQGIPADTIVSELGPGQFEINMQHTNDAVLSADHAILFKRLIKGVARRNGLGATFMAKPYAKKSGSGMHVHFSLLDDTGRNVFDSGDEDGSLMMRHAVAGLLNHMPESMLVFAPHMNSYRRFQNGAHAPTFASWGYENRTVAVRIPDSECEARRIEHRVAGADSNPYLVLAAILGAALHGIETKMLPPQPIEGDAYSLSERYEALPNRWEMATEAFQDSAFMREYLGETFVRVFTAVKEQEQEKIYGRISDVEYEAYL
ncbi:MULTISPECIES: glutamine synthetase family protein [Marinomonas]|uniref:Glutamine synthetase n=1 Tax=Marinomonas arctica TaxID=383750 RepID=A0A7H1J3J9_9GAMM|nr:MULTISPECIES: glutamine synthetase family protein [Marinomonas]MCS7486039.1 glutamine synthetase [Marinomonas sp. BSi20414]QNT05065.1 glutamine synthetase [Marinomonas arctica]GGN16426.1 glutamine synthetase [Marinomonas arctica]